VDEVVALGVDPHTVYLYWEVRPTTLAQAQDQHPEGKLAVRVAAVSPSWSGPSTQTRDHVVDALYGDLSVRGLEPGAIVRVSIGWLAGEHFQPLAIGDEVTTPRKLSLETKTSTETVAPTGLPDGAVQVPREPSKAQSEPLLPSGRVTARPKLASDPTPSAPRAAALRAPAERLGLDTEEEPRELLTLTEHVDEIASGVITTLRLRLRRVMRAGSSELAWEALSDEERLQLRARRRRVEFDRSGLPGAAGVEGGDQDLDTVAPFPWLGRRLRGGSSEWSLGGASDLFRRRRGAGLSSHR
jgi:hypothetical protein